MSFYICVLSLIKWSGVSSHKWHAGIFSSSIARVPNRVGWDATSAESGPAAGGAPTAGPAVRKLSAIGQVLLRPLICTTKNSLDVWASALSETTCLEIQIGGFRAPGYAVLTMSLFK